MVSICLHQIFESQADLRPSELALVSEEIRLTYAELDQRANQLARYLGETGTQPGDLVGIYLARKSESVTAILACLKMGAAYLRIDPAEKVERSWAVLNESRAALLLTDRSLAENARFAAKRAIAVVLEEHSPRISLCNPARLSPSASMDLVARRAPLVHDPMTEEMWSAFSKGSALIAKQEIPSAGNSEEHPESLILLCSMFAIPLAFLFAVLLLFRLNH